MPRRGWCTPFHRIDWSRFWAIGARRSCGRPPGSAREAGSGKREAGSGKREPGVTKAAWIPYISTVAEIDPTFLVLQSALAGEYSLERELGRGGMGIVYLAREVVL